MEPLAEDYRTRAASRLPKTKKDKVVRKQNKVIMVRWNPPCARASRSRCQHHRKRGSRHHV